jgi:hypothetical protein
MCWLLCLTGSFFLIHCGLGDIAEAGRQKEKKETPCILYNTAKKILCFK